MGKKNKWSIAIGFIVGFIVFCWWLWHLGYIDHLTIKVPVSADKEHFAPDTIPFISAILGFVVGVLIFVVSEFIKVRREKRALINLFVQHIDDVWSEVDLLKTAPIGSYWVRIKLSALGVNNLKFFGEPEYEFEVDDLRLFESHGITLAKMLRGNARKQFWVCYRLLRKADAVRRLIRVLTQGAQDRDEYQKLFVRLVEAYGKEILNLQKLLLRELGW